MRHFKLQKEIYKTSSIFGLVMVYGFIFSFAHAGALQVATTVTLDTTGDIQEGAIVVSNSDDDMYRLSQVENVPDVFGVTSHKPALVFSTGANQVPVVAEGVALVQVNGSGGGIARGDLLVTSSEVGVAKRAGELDENVFAVALEAYAGTGTDAVGFIQAEVGVAQAQAVRATQSQSTEDTQKTAGAFSLMRSVLASVLAIGALFFVLFSFRSTIAQGVVSVGRNPKARSSIVTLAFGNILFALILFGIVVFIAVAILVLPI